MNYPYPFRKNTAVSVVFYTPLNAVKSVFFRIDTGGKPCYIIGKRRTAPPPTPLQYRQEDNQPMTNNQHKRTTYPNAATPTERRQARLEKAKDIAALIISGILFALMLLAAAALA